MILTDYEKTQAVEHLTMSQFANKVDYQMAQFDAIEAAVITKLAMVSVEPVAWMCPDDPERETAFTWHQAKCQSNGCGKHRAPVYTAEAIAAARVQGIEEAAKIALENGDGTTWEAIRALVGGLE